MGCNCEPVGASVGPLAVFTIRSTTPVFIPLTGWFPAANVQRVLARLQIDQIGADVSVQGAFQTSNDLSSLTTTTVGSAQTATGLTFPAGTSVPAENFIRFGVNIANASAATEAQAALVSLDISTANH